VKKKTTIRKMLSLNLETLAALQLGSLEGAVGGTHYSMPPRYTCPECAPP
jgi:hypothetical protein